MNKQIDEKLRTHTHTHIVFLETLICMCVCMAVLGYMCVRDRDEKWRNKKNKTINRQREKKQSS